MHVLLTGGAGFIGRHVKAALIARGHQVRVLDSLRPDVHRNTEVDRSGDFVVADVRDGSAVDSALLGIDAVCHLAAKVGLGVDVQDLPDYASSNDYGTAVLLAAMTRAGIGRLTLAGSMVAYGEGLGRCRQHGAVRPAARRPEDLADGRFEAPCPFCGAALEPELTPEDTAVDPRNAYAASKVAQEHLARGWARATGGRATALRYHNVYGPGLPADTPYAGVAALFLSALRRGEAPRIFEDGRQLRDFVHVRDVARATVAAVESERETPVYNVGSGTPRTVGDLARGLADAVGGPTPMVTGEFRLGDVRHITADSSLLRDELGWRPEVNFADGLRELAQV